MRQRDLNKLNALLTERIRELDEYELEQVADWWTHLHLNSFEARPFNSGYAYAKLMEVLCKNPTTLREPYGFHK